MKVLTDLENKFASEIRVSKHNLYNRTLINKIFIGMNQKYRLLLKCTDCY